MEHRTNNNAPLGLTVAWLFILAGCTSGTPVSSSAGGAAATAASQQGVLQNSGPAGGTLSPKPPTAAVGGTSAATGGSPAPASGAHAGAAAEPAATALPCAVSKALATNCLKCHGSAPAGGAPMSLVNLSDFQKPAKTMPTLKVFELAKLRLQDAAKPMPPGAMISAADSATLVAWLGAGATPAAGTDTACGTDMKVETGQGTAATDGSTVELTALPGETCYDFPVHQGQTLDDKTPFSMPVGEQYELFYYRVPWPDGSVATRYGTKLDNAAIVHHWLLFTTAETDDAGTHKTTPLPTLLGVNATMLAGWAVGGTNVAPPDDVGLELPAHGTTLDVQWHFYNTSTSTVSDHSALQICTMPAGARPHTASITWLGTEDLNGNKWFGGEGMPPHQISTFSGTCTPSREGLKSDEPIHILAVWPHMHRLGTHMKTVVNHANGAPETIFDKAFDFNYQMHYPMPYELKAGDTLTSTCTYNNTTDKGAPYGESTDTEMCYQFTYAWPAHALDNHAASLIGTSNTCW